MNLLYYWQPDNYRRDRKFGFGYHLSQNNPQMRGADGGGAIWAFTRNRVGRYVLAAHMVVRRITLNRPEYRYGTYRAWANADSTRYFDVDVGADFEPVVRAMTMRSAAAILAQSFQGPRAVRPLQDHDVLVIEAFARDLPVINRVGFYPEDVLEARLIGEDVGDRVVTGGPAVRFDHLYRPGGRRSRRVQEVGLYTVGSSSSAETWWPSTNGDPRTNHVTDELTGPRAGVVRRHAAILRDHYDGRCQVCEYDPRHAYGHYTCHVHHLIWRSRGGDDDITNLVLLCPNHHAIVHRDDAAFDYADLTFSYANGTVEPLRLNQHLQVAIAS